jgi:hypothetical protein
MNFNTNTNSLDQCIATFQKSDYQTIKPLVLKNGDYVGTAGNIATNVKTFSQVLTDPVTNTTTAIGLGDAFNAHILCVLDAILLLPNGLLFQQILTRIHYH